MIYSSRKTAAAVAAWLAVGGAGRRSVGDGEGVGMGVPLTAGVRAWVGVAWLCRSIFTRRIHNRCHTNDPHASTHKKNPKTKQELTHFYPEAFQLRQQDLNYKKVKINVIFML